jgi:hypothetical protein
MPARQTRAGRYFDHAGLVSSIRQTGPPAESAASDFTKAGASPSWIHT